MLKPLPPWLRRYTKYLIILGPILLFLLVYLLVRLVFFYFTDRQA